MEVDRHSYHPGARAVTVAVAAGADMLLNFPLWIAAKRISASLPPLPEKKMHVYNGATALFAAYGPMTVVEDATVNAVKRIDAPPPVAAAIGGVAGALLVGAQTEALVTRAHALNDSVPAAMRDAYARGGLRGLVIPPGLAMVLAREVPYATCLFWLSGRVRRKFANPRAVHDPPWRSSRLTRDYFAALCTAIVAGPVSHVPACIGAHQQAHATDISTSLVQLRSPGGAGLWAGLLPRTLSLSGSLFIVPFSLEIVQNYILKN